MNQRNNLLAPCGIHPEGEEQACPERSEQGEGILKLIHPQPTLLPSREKGLNNNITLGKLKH